MASILFHMLNIMSQQEMPVEENIPLTFTAKSANSTVYLTQYGSPSIDRFTISIKQNRFLEKI